MLRERITDVFFDLDHTLWDFEKNSGLTFQQILEELGLQIDPVAFITTYSPINLNYWKMYRENRIAKPDLRYQRLKKTFDALSVQVGDDIIHRISEQYIEQLSTHTHLMENTTSILEYLKPKYNLHIITNGFEEVQEKKLTNSGIKDYFKEVVNSEMAGVKKPHRRIFELALEKARTRPEQSVMIGDNLEADILGAQALGFHTLHYSPSDNGEHQYGAIIRDLIEIKSYL